MKKISSILFLSLGLLFIVNTNASSKPNAYFCTYSEQSMNIPVRIYKFGTFGADTTCPNGKKISMREYVDVALSWYLKHPSYNFDSENGYISFLKSFKRKFTKHNLDTAYLDSKLIKNYSDKLDKNKLFTALKIAKEPTEKQVFASINMSKEEYDQTIKKEKKQRKKQKLKDEELKKKREEVQRLVEAEELRLKDPLYSAESELGISIKEATQETEVIKINEGYKFTCEVEAEDYSIIFNANLIKSNILKSEAVINFGQLGEIYYKLNQKISSSGKISKPKFKIHYSSDFDKDFKKMIKKFTKNFKDSITSDFIYADFYGETLKPIKIEDKKAVKKAKKIMENLAASLPDMKDLTKELKKLKMNAYRHYLGTTIIQSEKFYILRTQVVYEHPDENFLEDFDENTLIGYTFFHAASGFSFAVVMSAQYYPVCTIYKEDNELVTIDSFEIFN